MANAMVEMTSDPERLAEMGRSAYQRAAEWLSPHRIARETVAVYEEVLEKRFGSDFRTPGLSLA